ncbi:hypothetical protein EST38_g10829 [Candolleomyces aberdarensis]|uniref:NACHT domain-containing protein n=1 Tax=Candolleomyces aberdarensis TaxID=2316362 RepID=A0A4Q2D9P6_9AGAR|nr:hypothetical protein EST38_g10829 [Candolleomyces aberdarensis]
MSEAAKTRGDRTAGNSERNTPMVSRAATPAGSQSSRNSGLQQAKKTMGKPFRAIKRWVKSKMGDDPGEGGGAGSGGASAGSGIVTLLGGTGQELNVTSLGAQSTGGALNIAPSAPEETEPNLALGQDPASGTLAPAVDNASLALGTAQEVTQDSSAIPLSTLEQFDSSVPITTGEVTEPSTTTFITPTPETPSVAGEEAGSDSTEETKVLSPPQAGRAGKGAGVSNTSTTSSKKTWAIVAGALKKTLSGAVPFIPDPFKGPAEALLKIIDVFEQAKSNKEEMEDLKTRCNLLNESMAHAFKRRQDGGSDNLYESIGRLVKGIYDILLATMVESSTGVAAYVLVEDNAESLKEANRKIDQVLQCFSLENFIAGALVLSDVHRIIKDQEVTAERRFRKAALGELKPVPGAAYNSQDLAKISACFEGTRVKLLAGVGRWMSDPTGKPIYVLDGIAGIGKSTVAKTVAQRAAAIDSLGASFFFSRDHADRQHASSFVHTIAYQLAFCDPSYGEAIATAIDEHPESLHTIMAHQFTALVAQPLCNLLEQRATPLVFVFDALDECTQPDASEILSLIITSISKLPQVKVFLTTRPELVLRKKYQSTLLTNCCHLQEIEAVIVDSDIRLYLEHHLSSTSIQEAFEGMECASWVPTAVQKKQLVAVSDRLFIFASTAVKLILNPYGLGPEVTITSLLNLEPDQAMIQLYHKVLDIASPGHIPKESPHWNHWLTSFKIAIGSIVLLQYPLSVKALAKLMNTNSDSLVSILRNMHSVLAPFNDGPNPTYKIHHKSFPDFLTHSSYCPKEFWIEEQKYHLHLAKCCLETMKQQLQFNICQVPPADQYKMLATLPELNREKLTEELKYAVCNWATHLDRSNLELLDKEIEHLLEEFARKHLMHWFEALAYLGQLDTAIPIIETALTTLFCMVIKVM